MDYWAPSQKMMGDKGFIPRLKEYDKDNISPKIMKTIRTTYMPNEKFNAESAAKASSAAAGLCKWVLAMECYDRVAKVVAPKKEALEKTQAALAITMGELNKKKASLKVVQDDLAALQANLAGRRRRRRTCWIRSTYVARNWSGRSNLLNLLVVRKQSGASSSRSSTRPTST